MAKTLDLDLTAALPASITFSRAGTRTAIQGGVLVALASGAPAFESWDGVNQGLSVEAGPTLGAITNRLTYSNVFSNAAWTKTELTVGTGGTGPDGVASSMSLLSETTVSSSHQLRRRPGSQATGATQTFSAFVRSPSGNAKMAVRLRMAPEFSNNGLKGFFRFDGVPGFYLLNTDSTVTSPRGGVRRLANGLYQVWITGTWAATGNKEFVLSIVNQNAAPVDASYVGVVTDGFEAFGAQITDSSAPAGYIDTVAATASQAVETAVFNDTTWLTQAQGTFVIEHDCRTGVLVGSGANTVLPASVPGKVAIAWDASGSDTVSNGGASTASGTPPTFGADVRLLSTSAVGNVGHIKSIKFYNTRLSVAELQSLTAGAVVVTAQSNVLRAASIESRLPSNTFTTSGTQLKFASRYRMKLAGADLSQLRLDFANFYFGTAAVGNSVVIEECYFERVTGAAESVQVLFGGSPGMTMASGSANNLSDPILPSSFTGLSAFPANGEFWVRVRGSVTTAGHKIPIARSRSEPSGPDAFVYDTGTVTNMSGTGSLTLSGGAFTNMGGAGFCPILVGKYVSGDPKTVFLAGDSIVEGVGSLNYTGCFIRKSGAALGLGLIEFSLGGTAQHTISEGSYWKPYLAYCRIYVDDFGTNNGNALLHFFSLWKAARDAGIEHIQHVGLLPRSTSTDSWATEANQTVTTAYPTNTGIDAMMRSAAEYGYLTQNIVPVSVRGVDQAKWAPGNTGDGVHQNSAGDALLQPEYQPYLAAVTLTQATEATPSAPGLFSFRCDLRNSNVALSFGSIALTGSGTFTVLI